VNSNDWIYENIQSHHGALGAAYPDVSYGNEGDTPSWLGLIPNGLNNYEHPDWGGWGGRYELGIPQHKDDGRLFVKIPAETRPIWMDTEDSYTPWHRQKWGASIAPDTITVKNNKVTLWRWREHVQNDFAARMDWCVKPFAEANHPPVVKLNHPDEFTVKSGTQFVLDASPSYDPDGDGISYQWIQYTEAGTLKDASYVPCSVTNTAEMPWVIAPTVKERGTVHFVCIATDHGTPQLTRYKRVIVTVEP